MLFDGSAQQEAVIRKASLAGNGMPISRPVTQSRLSGTALNRQTI